jgi:hypothetical protein
VFSLHVLRSVSRSKPKTAQLTDSLARKNQALVRSHARFCGLESFLKQTLRAHLRAWLMHDSKQSALKCLPKSGGIFRS